MMSRAASFVKRRIQTAMEKLTSGSITIKRAAWNGSKRMLISMESRIFGFFTKAENQKDKKSLVTKTVGLTHGFISMTKKKSSVRRKIPREMGILIFGNSIKTASSCEKRRTPKIGRASCREKGRK